MQTSPQGRAGNYTRFGGRLRAALLATLLLVIVFPQDADAHGALRRSEPAEGAQLTVVPRELRLVFNETVELGFARLALTGPDGPVALGALTHPPDSASVLVAAVTGGLIAGPYTLAWQIAGEDGHPVRGQIAFTVAPGALGIAAVAAGPTAPGQETPPASHHAAASFPTDGGFDAESPLYVAIRWLTFVGLVGLLGAVAFRWILGIVHRRAPELAAGFLEPAASRAARLGLWMTGLVAVAGLLRLYAQSHALHGGSAALQPAFIGTMLTRTLWGWGWLLQAAGTLVAAIGFVLARRSTPALAIVGAQGAEADSCATTLLPAALVGGVDADVDEDDAISIPPRLSSRGMDPQPSIRESAHRSEGEGVRAMARRPQIGWWIAGLGALALAFTPGMSGHAASTSRLAPLPVVMDAVHVLGAGGWLGSLLVVLIVGIPLALRLAPGDRGPAVAALVNAFSPAALWFAGAVVATGVFAAWLHLPEIPALWESAYGRMLLLKLGILSVLFGTGAYNWLRVKPALGDEAAAGRLRRSAIVELVVGAMVLLVTAVLVATSPPEIATDSALGGGIAPSAER